MLILDCSQGCYSKNLTPWPLTLEINMVPDSPKDYVCTKIGQNPLKDVDSRVLTRMLHDKKFTQWPWLVCEHINCHLNLPIHPPMLVLSLCLLFMFVASLALIISLIYLVIFSLNPVEQNVSINFECLSINKNTSAWVVSYIRDIRSVVHKWIIGLFSGEKYVWFILTGICNQCTYSQTCFSDHLY
jgi:hypothetical protein